MTLVRWGPIRMPSAWQPPQSSQALTASTDNTILIQSEVRGFVTTPSREPTSACKGSRAVHKRPACPCSDAATSPASRSSSSVRFWLARTPPRAGLETSLDDQLDPQDVRAAEDHGHPAATKTSTHDHWKPPHQAAAVQQPLRLVAPIFLSMHRIATAWRY